MFRIDHVHIYSDKIDETVSFYKEMFGAKELRRVQGDSYLLIHLEVNGTRIVLSPANERNPVGLGHFALSVENMAPIVSKLDGLDWGRTDLVQVDKYSNVFLKDPNGVSIEILSPGTE